LGSIGSPGPPSLHGANQTPTSDCVLDVLARLNTSYCATALGDHLGSPLKECRRATLPKPPILPGPALSLIISDLRKGFRGIPTIPIGDTKVYNLRWQKPLNRPPEVSNPDQTGSKSAQNRSKTGLPILPELEKTALALAPRPFSVSGGMKSGEFHPILYTIVNAIQFATIVATPPAYSKANAERRQSAGAYGKR
jgi:hypothetical protein